MSQILRKLRVGLFAVGITGALGFGGMQALSAQIQLPTTLPVPCETEGCERACQGLFGPFASGFCGPEGECRCAV